MCLFPYDDIFVAACSEDLILVAKVHLSHIYFITILSLQKGVQCSSLYVRVYFFADKRISGIISNEIDNPEKGALDNKPAEVVAIYK